ncbi:MAG TPA: ATP-binding protein [Croceibacterium sp.]
MSQDHIGLFDTPPTQRQIRASLATAAVLVGAMLTVLVLPNDRLREIESIVPTIDAIMILSDLITATLLYVQASVFRSRGLTVLASGFVFIALILLTHMLSFPGAFAPNGVLGGGINTTGWTYITRRAALPAAVIGYVLVRRADLRVATLAQRPDPGIVFGLAVAIALAGAATVLVTLGHDLLPSMFNDRVNAVRNTVVIVNMLLIPLVGTAMVLLFRQRRSVLDMWLLVALTAWMVQLPVNMRDIGRFTVGFYAQFALMPFSNLVLMLALIAESSRLYARLALTTAARKRERDSLLMSMDAMAATFAHEIGQPFTAVTTNAKAGLNWLTRPAPNVDKAIEALRASLDAGKLTVSVIKSLRAMVATEPGTITEFCSNDLVRQTGQLLHRELQAAKVSLELELDPTIPLVQADRVQVQLVLVNLLMNAIDALAESKARTRRVTVRSSPLEGHAVLLEISDTGRGIATEDIDRIFEAFVTTKVTGTGLGLAISRVLTEEQGGRLWASHGENGGASFHLQLPCGAAVPSPTRAGASTGMAKAR